MPLDEATLPSEDESTLSDASIEPEDLPQPAEAEQPAPVEIPAFPHDPHAKITHYGPNGEQYMSDGTIVLPDGTNMKSFPNGVQITHAPGMKPVVTHAPAPKAANTVVADMTGPDGVPYKAVIDKDKHTATRIEGDPGSRPAAQAEMLRIRMLNSAKSQPGIVGYVNVKNNYDSLAQNAAIPADKRTPADDAAAIQAFGAIEHPGTGVTDADKKQAEELVPKWTKLKMIARNWTQNKSQILDAGTVTQMRDAAKRALDGRQKTYNDEIAPLIEEAKRVGLHPAQVNGALGANVADYEVPKPQVAPPQTPQEWIEQNKNNPDPVIQKKVKDVQDKLALLQGGQ